MKTEMDGLGSIRMRERGQAMTEDEVLSDIINNLEEAREKVNDLLYHYQPSYEGWRGTNLERTQRFVKAERWATQLAEVENFIDLALERVVYLE